MTQAEALTRACATLSAAGIPAPMREARVLLAHAQGSNGVLLPEPDAPVPPAFWSLLDRRRAREPMAFITGRQGFWTLDLETSPDTLIPRADSETLIEAALAACPERSSVCGVLDLGTGTGALLLAALTEFPAAFGVGLDRSAAACALAARNARACGLSHRSAFVVADWALCLAGRFDLVLANPPYIASGEIGGLMPEVASHEPRAALDGGADGLDAYRAIVPGLPRLLRPGGIAVLELGQGQAAPVAALLARHGLGPPALRADLAGIPRAIVGRRSAS